MKVTALLSGVVLCATALSVQAADLGRRRPPPPPPPAPAYVVPPFSWTGLYFGGQIGGDWARANWVDPFGGVHDKTSGSGFLAGGQVGYNYQMGPLVAGVEGDFSWTNADGTKTDAFGNKLKTRLDWTSTVTGRLGYAVDRVLFYGKGGAAFAHDKDTLTDPFGAVVSGAATRTGWTAGAGVEYGFANNWSAKVEYDYLGFGTQNVTLGGMPASIDLKAHELKGGINYHF